jgi:hypothetical protein
MYIGYSFKKNAQSETALHHSAVRCLIQAIQTDSLIIKAPCNFIFVLFVPFCGHIS